MRAESELGILLEEPRQDAPRLADEARRECELFADD